MSFFREGWAEEDAARHARAEQAADAARHRLRSAFQGARPDQQQRLLDELSPESLSVLTEPESKALAYFDISDVTEEDGGLQPGQTIISKHNRPFIIELETIFANTDELLEKCKQWELLDGSNNHDWSSSEGDPDLLRRRINHIHGLLVSWVEESGKASKAQLEKGIVITADQSLYQNLWRLFAPPVNCALSRRVVEDVCPHFLDLWIYCALRHDYKSPVPPACFLP